MAVSESDLRTQERSRSCKQGIESQGNEWLKKILQESESLIVPVKPGNQSPKGLGGGKG